MLFEPSNHDDRLFWALLAGVKGIGPARLRKLVDMFGEARAAWYADSRALTGAGLERRARQSLIQTRADVDPETVSRKYRDLGVRIVTSFDDDYPERLRGIHEAPAVLFVAGALPDPARPTIAVVGTRKASIYGRQAAQKLAGDLAAAGVVIVSGLARGVDVVAHQATMAAGGVTVAVLGSGLDRVYPPNTNRWRLT